MVDRDGRRWYGARGDQRSSDANAHLNDGPSSAVVPVGSGNDFAHAIGITLKGRPCPGPRASNGEPPPLTWA